ncbi:MAG: sulfite exporter TauE/SafE family protein [Candidatus Onthomonas sp.]
MLDTVTSVLLFLVLFFANGIQAITGFAGTLLAMPPCIRLIGADNAKTVLNILAQASCLMILLGSLRCVNWRELGKMLGLMLVGMAVGIWLYSVLPLDFLLTVYGILIILIALQKLFLPRLFPEKGRWLTGIVPLAGIIHGMFVSGGALLVVYASGALPRKEEFRATMAAVWFFLGFFLTAAQVRSGEVTADVLCMTAFCLIPMALGTWLGGRLVKRISQQLFMKITYVLLVISGILAIV